MPPTDPATSARMRAVRASGTGPELALRSALRALGLRPRPGRRIGRTTPDLLLPGVAVYVDGCFWHGCPRHHRPPRRNAAWWAAKIAGNRRRDRRHAAALRRAGWSVARVWEHEDPGRAARRVARLVR